MKINAAFSGFSIDDTEKAKDFYGRVLGLDLADETMGLRFRLPYGGMVFMYPKPNHEPATYTVLNFVVEDIDEAVRTLTEQGVKFEHYDEIVPGVQQEPSGIMRTDNPETDGPSIAWFKDPAGNTLAVLQDTEKHP